MEDKFVVKEYPLNNGFTHGIFIGKKCIAKVRGKKIANIFTAAPNLLEALKSAKTEMERTAALNSDLDGWAGHGLDIEIDKIDTAIAEAEGK